MAYWLDQFYTINLLEISIMQSKLEVAVEVEAGEDKNLIKEKNNIKESHESFTQYNGELKNSVSVIVPHKIYKNLLDAKPDRGAIQLDINNPKQQQVNGLFTWGVASCVVIIIKSESGKRLSLNHVSSLLSNAQIEEFNRKNIINGIPEEFCDALTPEVEFVSQNGLKDYTIELGISPQGYRETCDPEDRDKTYDDLIEQITETEERILEFTGKQVVKIYELPYSMLLLDRSGKIMTFKEIKEGKIEIITPRYHETITAYDTEIDNELNKLYAYKEKLELSKLYANKEELDQLKKKSQDDIKARKPDYNSSRLLQPSSKRKQLDTELVQKPPKYGRSTLITSNNFNIF